MLPFGETILAWRLARGLTQAALARSARVARPNLSAIERGEREVTLKTLRALALALDVRPGVLADGIAPDEAPGDLSRESLERIATSAAFGGAKLDDKREAFLASCLRTATSAHRPALRRKRRQEHGRSADRAYFLFKTAASPSTVKSLLDRLRDRIDSA